MKTINETYLDAVSRLLPSYGEPESKSMIRILLEDGFFLPNVTSSQPFSGTDRLEDYLERLLANEPLQYLLGQADFYGLKFKVDRRVLIPRQETEELVFWILETIRGRTDLQNARVLDIGTGSGCIPIVLKKNVARLEVGGLDISGGALQVAAENALRNEVEVRFWPADILKKDEWPALGHWDVVVSNPPYIPERERSLMPQHVLAFEPGTALFVSNEDPLVFYRYIAHFAWEYLRPGGLLFFELNEFNAQQVEGLVADLGFPVVELAKDMQGKWRMLRAEKGK